MAKICPECQYPNLDKAETCFKCGADISDIAMQEARARQRVEQTRQREQQEAQRRSNEQIQRHNNDIAHNTLTEPNLSIDNYRTRIINRINEINLEIEITIKDRNRQNQSNLILSILGFLLLFVLFIPAVMVKVIEWHAYQQRIDTLIKEREYLVVKVFELDLLNNLRNQSNNNVYVEND